MSDKSWVLVEQSEGLVVETQFGGDTEVTFIDYDECKNADDKGYVRIKIAEVANSLLPQSQKDRVIATLESYL